MKQIESPKIITYKCYTILFLLLSPFSFLIAQSFTQEPHSFPEYSDKYTTNQFAPILEPGKKLYVSVHGNDKNVGTKIAPFKSLEAARDAVRKLKSLSGLPAGGVQIIVLEGTYLINNSFTLTEEDSGTVKAPIVYQGVQKDKVVLSGGVPIDAKRLKLVIDTTLLDRLKPSARGKVMSIDLSNDKVASLFPGEGKYGQISMDGYMLQLAQWPNRGYNHIGEIVEEGPTTRWLKPGEKAKEYSRENPTGGKFILKETLSPSIQKEFERTGDMHAQGYFHNDWYFQDESIGKMDSGTIQLLRYTRYGIVGKITSLPRRVRLYNVLAELDEPGEWYFDKKEQRLYVWPIKGFTAGKSSLTVTGNQLESINNSFEPVRNRNGSDLEQPMLKMNNTEYITFRDFTIENSSNIAVSISGGKYNLLAGSTIRNGAGKGIRIEGGKCNGITGCDFYDLYSAFNISGGDFKSLDHCYNFATNNIIRDCRLRGYGVIGLSGVGIYFAHNLLSNMNGAVMYETVDLLMEYNEFFNIGWEMGDFNVAYCGAQWHTMNNVVRYNFVHHLIEPGGHPILAFRNDDGGAGLKIYGNVMYRSGRGGGTFNGFLNDFQNNIVLETPVMWWTLKNKITPEGIKAEWDDLQKFGRDLPKGDKGDHIYIMEQLIGEKGWLKSPWKEAFPQLAKAIEINPWAQTFCNVNLNYTYKVREEFHIHGGSGTIEGMESKESGKFKDLPKDGVFELPSHLTLDAFEDVTALDFRFKPTFKPVENFKVIPFENIGLVNDVFRPTTPDKKQYRSAVYNRFKNEEGFKYDAKIVNARYPLPEYLK